MLVLSVFKGPTLRWFRDNDTGQFDAAVLPYDRFVTVNRLNIDAIEVASCYV